MAALMQFGSLKLHRQVVCVVDAFRRFEGGKNCNGCREVKRRVERGIVADLQELEPRCINLDLHGYIDRYIDVYIDSPTLLFNLVFFTMLSFTAAILQNTSISSVVKPKGARTIHEHIFVVICRSVPSSSASPIASSTLFTRTVGCW